MTFRLNFVVNMVSHQRMTFLNVLYEIKEFLNVTSAKKYFHHIMRFLLHKKRMFHSQDIEIVVFLMISQTSIFLKSSSTF